MLDSREKEHIQLYNNYFNKYTMLALDIFVWENLPPTIESRHIEYLLFTYGQLVVKYTKEYGIVVCKFIPTGQPNIYGEFTKGYAIGYGKQYGNIKLNKDAVRMLNNDLAYPTVNYVKQYSSQMVDLQRSINANIRQQKIPYIIETDADTLKTIKTAMKQIEDGDTVIFANKKTAKALSDTKAHSISPPLVFKDLQQQKKELENEILTFLGLNNTKEKKERMVVDEVNVNNEFIQRNVTDMLRQRENAVEKINTMFNLNIKVSLKNNEITEHTINEGGEGDGNIYPSTT